LKKHAGITTKEEVDRWVAWDSSRRFGAAMASRQSAAAVCAAAERHSNHVPRGAAPVASSGYRPVQALPCRLSIYIAAQSMLFESETVFSSSLRRSFFFFFLLSFSNASK